MAESALLTCAKLAGLVYRNEREFRYECETLGLHVTRFVVVRNHVAAIARHPSIGFLVFRGTDDAQDWRDNIDTRWGRTPSGCVHRGFLRGLDLLWPELQDYLFTEAGRTWWVTGHSLGGALATLAAMRMHERAVQPWIATFGQPPVGRIEFVWRYQRTLGQRHYRFVHGTDIVSDVPLLAHHVGRKLYINGKGRLVEKSSFLVKVSDAMWRGWNGQAFGQLANHRMQDYITRLEGADLSVLLPTKATSNER